MFSLDVKKWVKWYFVLTNVGLLRFETGTAHEHWPRIIPLLAMRLVFAKGRDKVEGRANLFEVRYRDKEKKE